MTTSGNEIEQTVTGLWQKLLGIDSIGRDDNFFQLGGDALLATRLLSKLRQLYCRAELSWRDLHEHPTVAGLAQQIERFYASANEPYPPVKALFIAAPAAERGKLIETYLKQKIADALRLDVDQFTGDLTPANLETITADLIWDFRGDFQLPVYRHEILKRPAIEVLAEFITSELEHRYGLRRVQTNSGPTLRKCEMPPEANIEATGLSLASRNEPAVFLLSAPRSGSTLLRLMLAGHPGLFCPPELSLLEHETMRQWLQKRFLRFPKESGIVYNLLRVMGLAPTQAMVDDPQWQAMSVQQIYHLIQQHTAPRLLVDKTPNYAKSLTTLRRAESWFDQPKYIHLVRHPYAVIESFVRHRFERFIGLEGVDPYECAEQAWTERNRNILTLSQIVGSQRYYRVHYEELMRQPARVMQEVCEFLKISFEEAMLYPYSGGRMIGGPGDPDIFQHDQIEPHLGEIWRDIILPRPLTEETRRLAVQFNYELPRAG